MTADHVRLRLRAHLNERGYSQKQWAKLHGISPSYVSDFLGGRREPGELILDAMGLHAMTTYEPKGYSA